MGDQPRHVRITTDGNLATVHVDGTNLSRHLCGYTLEHRADQLPMLVLYARPGTDGAVFEGMAHVVVGDEPTDPADQIAAFLRSVDPQALEQAALHRDDLGTDRYALARAMLQQAADWAQGRA